MSRQTPTDMGTAAIVMQHRALVETSRPTDDRGLDCELLQFLKGSGYQNVVYPGARILDIGCGQGRVINTLAERYGAEAYGIDLRPINAPKITVADAIALPFPDSQFDFVLSYATLPYIPDKLRAVAEAHRVLAVGGIGVLDVAEETIPAVRPRLNEIIACYPNKGQLSLDIVRMTTGPRWPDRNDYHVSERLVIKKRSEEPLEFPPLSDVMILTLSTRKGVAPGNFAVSFYDISRTRVGKPHLRLI